MTTFAALAAAEESGREMPIPPILVGVLAIIFFAFLLGVTWSFRGSHNKYARPKYGEGSTSGSQTGPTQSAETEDAAHWPEHPGHH